MLGSCMQCRQSDQLVFAQHICRCSISSHQPASCSALNAVCRHCFAPMQMCGVFLVFIASMHRLLDWGFPCHPRIATLLTVLYYSSAVGCIIAGLRARTALRRGLPLGLLFLVRFGALLTRKLLHSGAQESLGHYAVMEVSLHTALRIRSWQHCGSSCQHHTMHRVDPLDGMAL